MPAHFETRDGAGGGATKAGRRLRALAAALALAAAGAAWTAPALAAGPRQKAGPGRKVPLVSAPAVLFDDFRYASYAELEKHGWIVRTKAGWPGVSGAVWQKQGVSFVRDGREPVLRMTSTTAGPNGATTQTQICHERKYLEGTYAARVRFTDAPQAGPDGDQLVQSFYTISPLKAPMDLDYSENDFEYLPNGGWGIDGPTLYGTTWETFSPEPNWKKDNTFDIVKGEQGGWHVLVLQVADGAVKYFVDGKPLASHGDKFFPESLMSINFNLWFISGGQLASAEPRRYTEDIDWVFHQAKTVLSPAEVEARVGALRKRGVRYRDTVARPVPALESPCDF